MQRLEVSPSDRRTVSHRERRRARNGHRTGTRSTGFAYPELDFSEPPAGSDRRAFMVRSAMVVAIVAVGGCKSEPLFGQVAAKAPPLGSGGGRSEPECREEIQGSGDDPGRRILQSRAGTVLVAHDRPDADHLRFLPARGQTAGRPTWPRRPRSRCICSAASAPPARGMARSGRRWPVLSDMSRRRSIRLPFSTRWRSSRTRFTRSSWAPRRSTSR